MSLKLMSNKGISPITSKKVTLLILYRANEDMLFLTNLFKIFFALSKELMRILSLNVLRAGQLHIAIVRLESIPELCQCINLEIVLNETSNQLYSGLNKILSTATESQ